MRAVAFLSLIVFVYSAPLGDQTTGNEAELESNKGLCCVAHLPVCLSVCSLSLSLSLSPSQTPFSLRLSLSLSFCLSVCLSRPTPFSLRLSRSLPLSACLSLSLSVSLSLPPSTLSRITPQATCGPILNFDKFFFAPP